MDLRHVFVYFFRKIKYLDLQLPHFHNSNLILKTRRSDLITNQYVIYLYIIQLSYVVGMLIWLTNAFNHINVSHNLQ